MRRQRCRRRRTRLQKCHDQIPWNHGLPKYKCLVHLPIFLSCISLGPLKPMIFVVTVTQTQNGRFCQNRGRRPYHGIRSEMRHTRMTTISISRYLSGQIVPKDRSTSEFIQTGGKRSSTFKASHCLLTGRRTNMHGYMVGRSHTFTSGTGGII